MELKDLILEPRKRCRRLAPNRIYRDELDGEVKSGSEWMAFFRRDAIQFIADMKSDFKRLGRKPAHGEIPTLKEQYWWMYEMYTAGGEYDHHLVEV